MSDADKLHTHQAGDASKSSGESVAKPARLRRWLQFSVKTLLVVTFLACLLFARLAYLSQSGRQQRVAARALQQRGASVQFDRRVDSDSPLPTSVSDGPFGAFADMFAPNVDDVFAEDQPLTDADLINLRGLKRLDRLVLSGTKITDAGLEQLRHVPQLPNLWLSRTAITDAGLVHLKAVPRLEILLLDGTHITDAGLVHLRSLPRLRVLDLSNTAIGDGGLAHLQAVKQLELLQLKQTRITDAGLAHLQSLERLEDLDLNDTKITSEGFAQVRNVPCLTRLYLDNTRLSDAGMAQLRKFASLVVLNIKNTPASDAAVEKLRQALPELMIDGISYQRMYGDANNVSAWSLGDSPPPHYGLGDWLRDGPDEPTAAGLPPRLAAALEHDSREFLAVQSIPMTETIRRQLSRLRRVRWLRLSSETRAADLSWIGGLTQLRGLSLQGANLTGCDFRNLTALQSLQWLNLSDVDMSADDFATLPPLASLHTLFLSGRQVTDAYLLHLTRLQLPRLARLSLDTSSVSDAGLVPFCTVYNLEYLNLFLSQNVTEQSVSALGRMTNLRTLGIGGSGLTPNYGRTPAVEQLCRLLPNCSVDYGD